MSRSRSLFTYFREQLKQMPVSGFEPRISGIGSDRSAEYATSKQDDHFTRFKSTCISGFNYHNNIKLEYFDDCLIVTFALGGNKSDKK